MANSILTSKWKIEISKGKAGEHLMKAKRKNLFMIIFLFIVFTLTLPAYAQLTFSGKSCSGNQLCDSQITCDASGVCNSQLSNCEACGTAVKACPDGSVATAPNVCVGAVGGAECRPGVPICRASSTQEATKVLPFAVFTKKGFVANITPPERTAIAGATVQYEITVENQNPIPLSLQIGRQVPQGWSSDAPTSLSLGPKSKDRFVLTVSSNVSATDGTYAVAIIFFNPELNIVGSATAKYTVASRGAPSLRIEPRSQPGVPGQSVFFTVTVTNNDPAEFDAAQFLLLARPPAGWSASFNSSLLRIAPGQEASTVLAIGVPQNVSEGDIGTISVNVTSGRLSVEGFADVTISLCGNGICDVNEACDIDCPPEEFFTCAFGNGRCEQQIDDGVEFSAVPNFLITRFVACSRNAKEEECLKAADAGAGSCGFGKPCLCASSLASQCSARCVDSKGAYYLFGTGVPTAVRSAANYSFACPFVNLPEIVMIRNSFANARDSYEKARSALGEAIKISKTDKERSTLQPCFDALGIIIGLSADHINLLDAIIKSPAVSNTTAARERTAELKSEIETLFNTNCRGASGLMQIRRIVPPGGVEKGDSIVSGVDVINIGDTTYFGRVQCDYVAPSQQRSVFESSCTEFPAGVRKSFTPVANATEAGPWKLQCKTLGSLKPDCSAAEIHDFEEALFNVSTREVFVVDVSGFCSSTGITCEVRASSEQPCTQCFIGSVSCQKLSQSGAVSAFRCPSAPVGFADITGRVVATPQCIPVQPVEKTSSVLCEGCGDGIVLDNEQCELPNTDNNNICSQNTTICDGKRFGQRDSAGFCTPTCSCSEDQFTFVCQVGKCSASCSDGQTRNVTITKPGGTCVAVQQCGSTCEFQPADCEVGSICGNNICQTGESVVNCPQDCSASQCGNGVCNTNENPTTCPQDCAPAAPRCAIRITSQNCSFVPATNRYDVRLSVAWQAGDHAHAIVEDDTSQKFLSNFTSLHSLAGPGLKSIRVEVHNATDTMLCFNTSQIQCAPGGTTTGRNVDVVRSIPDLAGGTNALKTGAHIVTLQITPYADIQGFELKENVQSPMSATLFSIFGNTSPVVQSFAPVVEGTATFNQHSFRTDLRAGRTMSIQYQLSTQSEGTYALYWQYVAFGSSVSEQPRMLLDFTSCPQTFPVTAVGPSGDCKVFTNSCKKPADYQQVTECPKEIDFTDVEPVTETGDSTWLIILIIVLIIIVILIIRYRDEIKERLGREEEEEEINFKEEEPS